MNLQLVVRACDEGRKEGRSDGRTDVAGALHVGAAVARRQALRVAVARPAGAVARTRSLDATRAVLAGAAQSRADTAAAASSLT